MGQTSSKVVQRTLNALSSSLNDFRAAYGKAAEQTPQVHEVIDAVKHKRVIYLAEPWITADTNTVANELLFRFRPNREKLYSYGTICNSIHNAGLTAEFDLVNVFNILSWIPDDVKNTAATINLSHDLLINQKLMNQIVALMDKRKGPPVIFEILEDARQFTAPQIAYLKSLKDKGLCFALDDFRVSHPSDWQRLASLKDVLTYVKLDGEDSVRPFLDGESGELVAFAENIKAIQSTCGTSKRIIAEWVQNREEADICYASGVYAIQGHDIIMHQSSASNPSP